jgi:hypothetical protein
MGYGWWATAVRCIAIVWTLFEWYVGLALQNRRVLANSPSLQCRALNAADSAL